MRIIKITEVYIRPLIFFLTSLYGIKMFKHLFHISWILVFFLLCNTMTVKAAYFQENVPVSGNMSAIGNVRVSSIGNQAARWTNVNGIELLGFIREGGVRSIGINTSANGLVAVGNSESNVNNVNFNEPFKWTKETGMVGLGDVSGRANATSFDGTTIVGWYDSTQGKEAFRWTQESGITGLGDLPGGAFKSTAYDISDDGTMIVGEATGQSGLKVVEIII